jgi:hypothetical protein
MTTDEKQPEPGSDRTRKSNDQPADSTGGTETTAKGGAEAAKRQAERDWQDSSKEAGE